MVVVETAIEVDHSSEEDWQAARKVWDQVRVRISELRTAASEMERDLRRFEAKFTSRATA